MRPERVATWSELEPLTPAHALVENVDLVVIRERSGEDVSVLYGRCLHRGALLADGTIVVAYHEYVSNPGQSEPIQAMWASRFQL